MGLVSDVGRGAGSCRWVSRRRWVGDLRRIFDGLGTGIVRRSAIMSDRPEKLGTGEGLDGAAAEPRRALEFSSVSLSVVCDCAQCGSSMSTRAEFNGAGAPESGPPICLDCAAKYIAEVIRDG